jgi:diamine N-acetyltransferase
MNSEPGAVYLAPITQDNYRACMNLRVAESQVHDVAPNAKALGEAYAYYGTSRPYAIYRDEQMVGFVLLRDLPDLGCYYISQFMIDERYQRKGYGRQAMLVLLEMLKKERRFSRIDLCYVEGAEGAKRLYEGLGFWQVGEPEAGEVVMALNIA